MRRRFSVRSGDLGNSYAQPHKIRRRTSLGDIMLRVGWRERKLDHRFLEFLQRRIVRRRAGGY